jgi:DNA-directed RNA polymerase subunit RPC12/RpoP
MEFEVSKSPNGDRVVELTCPGCGWKTKKSVRWLRNHTEVLCARCGRSIENREADLAAKRAWSRLRRISKKR